MYKLFISRHDFAPFACTRGPRHVEREYISSLERVESGGEGRASISFYPRAPLFFRTIKIPLTMPLSPDFLPARFSYFSFLLSRVRARARRRYACYFKCRTRFRETPLSGAGKIPNGEALLIFPFVPLLPLFFLSLL